MSTIYLAGRLDSGEETIGQFANELEARGHHVLEKWWLLGRLPTPYLEHEEAAPAAQAMITAAYGCETFILFPTDSILGAAVELGAALGSAFSRPNKRVFIVDPQALSRQSVFYAHPQATAVSFEELRSLLLA